MEQFNYDLFIKLKLNKRRRIWKRILCVLMGIVVFATTYMLILPAITKETKSFCGIAEHTHDAACNGEGMTCGIQEHTHELICFSDPSADVETEEEWRATLPMVDGVSKENVLTIAHSQLDYTESSKNYEIDKNGNLKGYTRYGAWYGSPYADWDALFVAFCLRYAGVNYPYDASSGKWVEMLTEQDRYKAPSDYIPQAGDPIFFDEDGDGTADHVGLVNTVDKLTITTIEGDVEGRIVQNTYDLFDKRIAGYGVVEIPRTAGDSDTVVHPQDVGAWAELLPPDETATAKSAGNNSRMVRSAARSTFNAPRAITLDLTPYINYVEMYDEDGNPIASGSTVTEGDLIEFKIEYTVTGQQLGVMNGENVTVKADTLTYQLPKTFKMVQSESGNIHNSVGVVVGTYMVDSESGTITMSFTDSFVEQNAKGLQIHGFISVYSTVVKVSDADSEDEEFKFTDDIILGVTIKEKKEAVGDLKIEKTKVNVSGEEIIYEVTVTSEEGTNGPITITDQMSKGLTFIEGIGVWKGNGTPVSNATFQPSADKSSFTMTLPELAAGGSYRVRYRCKADVDLLDADMTVRNTATVEGKDSEDNELTDKTTVDHIFDMVKKTGVENGDGTITWTITVNQAKADISGWVLEDILSTNAGSKPYTGKVNISDTAGNVLYANVNLPFTFPQNSNNTYVITYTTTHGLGDGDNIYNKAILKDNDTEINVMTGVGIGTPITKTGTVGEPIQDENGNYLLPITWTVTIDTSSGPIPGGRYLYDKMEGFTIPAEDMYMTYDQLMTALTNMEAEVIRVSGQELEWFEAALYQPGSGHGRIYDILELWNNTDGCQDFVYERFSASLGSAGIPQGHLLTFSYETYGVFPNNVITTSVFVNRFNINEQYEVESRVDYTAGTIKGTKYAISYYDPTNENNPEWHWGTIEWGGMEGTSYFDYEKLRQDYLAWAIELSVPPNFAGRKDVIIYEDLPDGVTVKAIELPFLNNLPDKRMELRDLAPGNTYTWEFTLLPADKYGTWRPTGYFTVTATVEITEEGDIKMTMPGILFETMAQRAALEGLDEWWGHLYIYTQINDDFEWTPRSEGSHIYVNSFENRFTISIDDGEVLDIGSQTQIITKDEREGVIRKEASVDKNNIITYSVILNAYKKDLLTNAGMLSVHDELTYTSTDDNPVRLRLVPGSVKLYEVRVHSDGSYTILDELEFNYRYNENSTERNGITNWIHTIDLNVPDSKSLLLEYAYKASGVQNTTHDIQNACTITGVGEGEIGGDHELEVEMKDAMAQADTEGVVLYKVDSESDGVFLEKAKFNIYIWNAEQNKYIIVHHLDNGSTDFVTDSTGMIVLDGTNIDMDQFAYNTAYYIVEIESPGGYYLGPEPYYFYIAHDNLVAYPMHLPPDFEGKALTSGDIIYRKNISEFTEIRIEKYWQNRDGDSITVTGDKVDSVTLELWQMLKGDANSAKLYGTYTMTPDAKGNWSLVIENLPKATKNADGTKGTDYLYYVKEVDLAGYNLESTVNNEGTNMGTITLVNRAREGYLLPETGGAGTLLYTVAGLLLTLSSITLLVYKHKKCRREELDSS